MRQCRCKNLDLTRRLRRFKSMQKPATNSNIYQNANVIVICINVNAMRNICVKIASYGPLYEIDAVWGIPPSLLHPSTPVSISSVGSINAGLNTVPQLHMTKRCAVFFFCYYYFISRLCCPFLPRPCINRSDLYSSVVWRALWRNIWAIASW